MTNRQGMGLRLTLRVIALRAIGLLPVGILAAACAGLTHEPAVGGESSFLRACSADCGDKLECVSHVCTRGCLVNKDSCADLAKNAVCTNASIESGNVAVCDVACASNAECGALGSHFSCENGYCRGKQLPSGQGGAGGSTTAEGGAGNSSGASCRVAYQDYPSGTKDIPIADGSSCGSCSCDNGTLNCTKLDTCPNGQPIVACPTSFQTDLVARESFPFIGGDSLSLTVQTGGGCATHEFKLCYDPEIFDTQPPTMSLRLIHDAHGDSCDALLNKLLHFDLSPLGRYISGSSPNAGGVVGTNYGQYAYGEATCAERQASATEQLSRSIQDVDMGCSTAADCQWVS
ncbi:MAG TPA: hypothetical protein VIV60_05870, partial [Polyangiaceae bacterium]